LGTCGSGLDRIPQPAAGRLMLLQCHADATLHLLRMESRRSGVRLLWRRRRLVRNARRTQLHQGWGRTSPRMRMTRIDPTLFWARVAVRGPNACWKWLGGRNGDGYGYFKQLRVNRLAFRLAHGRFPRRLACHSCNNRLCCNPKHIYDGSHKQNMRDMAFAGRHDGKNRRGQRHPNSKLTDRQRDIIRQSSLSGSVLSKKYKVSPATISMIRHDKRRAKR
jgi:hypothetical protein